LALGSLHLPLLCCLVGWIIKRFGLWQTGREHILLMRILASWSVKQSYIYQDFGLLRNDLFGPRDVGPPGATLRAFRFFPSFLTTRVTHWGTLRSCFRAAFAMRADSAWVAMTRTLNMSHLPNSAH